MENSISVADFLRLARSHYKGEMKVLCALGAAIVFARRAQIPGMDKIEKNGMPTSMPGASFLKILNPELDDEQASRWYAIIIRRNDCQQRRSRAWSTLRKASLIGHHFRFEPVGENYKPIFVVPDFYDIEVSESDVLDQANPNYDWPYPDDSIFSQSITGDEIGYGASFEVACLVE